MEKQHQCLILKNKIPVFRSGYCSQFITEASTDLGINVLASSAVSGHRFAIAASSNL